MGMTVGNLRVMLTLDSSQYIRGVNQAESQSKGFERAFQAAFENMGKVATRLGDAVGSTMKEAQGKTSGFLDVLQTITGVIGAVVTAIKLLGVVAKMVSDETLAGWGGIGQVLLRVKQGVLDLNSVLGDGGPAWLNVITTAAGLAPIILKAVEATTKLGAAFMDLISPAGIFSFAAKEADALVAAVGKVASAIGSLTHAAAVVGGAVAASVAGFSAASTMAAARVGEMNAALGALAKQNNLSKDAMDAQVQSVRQAGITYGVAQNLVAQFARNQMDMSKATDLARVAQDLAIFTMQDSSDTLQELLHGIQTGNTQLDVFRQLNIQAGSEVAKYAASVGKSTQELTGQERSQALLNAVLAAGIPIAGTYAAAMEEPGKVLRSFPRLFNDIQVAIGQAFLPAFGEVILAAYRLTTTIRNLISEGGALAPFFNMLKEFISGVGAPIADLIQKFDTFLKTLRVDQVASFSSSIEGLIGPLTVAGAALAGFATPTVLQQIPVIGDMFSGLNPIVTGLAFGLGTLILTNSNVQASFGQMMQAIGPALGAFAQLGAQVISTLSPAITDLVIRMMPLVVSVVEVALALAQLLIPALIQIIPPMAEIAGAILTALQPAFKLMSEAIVGAKPLIDMLVQAFLNMVPYILKAVENLAPLASIIVQVGATLAAALIPFIVRLMDVIAPLLPPIASLVAALGQALLPILPALVQAFIPLLGPLVDIAGVLLRILVPILQYVFVPLLIVVTYAIIGLIGVINTIVGWLAKWGPVVAALTAPLWGLIAAITAWKLLTMVQNGLIALQTFLNEKAIAQKQAGLATWALEKAAMIAGTAATWAQTAATTALSIATNSLFLPILAIIGVVLLLALIFYKLYQNCEPVRNILNAIGAFFKGVFLTTVSAVGTAIGWLADNFGGFASVLSRAFGWIGGVLGAIGGFVKSIAGWFTWLWEVLWGGSVLRDLVTGIQTAFGWITDAIGAFTGWIKGAWDWVVGVFVGAWNFIKDNLATIIPIIVGLIFGPLGALIVWILMNQEQAKQIFLAAWTWIKDTVGGIATAIWSTLTAIFTGVWQTLVTIWNAIWGAITFVATAIWTTLTTIWNTIWQTISSIATGIWTTLSNIWTAIWGTITWIVTAIWNTLSSWWNLIWQTISGIVTGIWSTLSNLWNSIWSTITSIVTGIWNTLSQWWNWIWQTITSIVMGIWTTLTTWWNTIWQTITGVVTGIWNTVTQWFTWLWQSITNIVMGIWNTMVMIWTWIRDNTVGLVQQLWNWVTERFWQFFWWAYEKMIEHQKFMEWIWSLIKDNTIGRVQAMVEAVVTWFNNLKSTVEGIVTGLRDSVAGLLNQMLNWVIDRLNWIIDRLNDFIKKARDGLGKFGVDIPADWGIPNIPNVAFARGDIVERRTIATVGEEGRESIIPWNPRRRQRAQALWEQTGNALGFFDRLRKELLGNVGGPGGSLGNWWDGNFPMTQGPGGGFSHGGMQAWDYAMPNGTPIKMGLPGTVVKNPMGGSSGYGIHIGVNLEQGGSLILGHLQSILADGNLPVGTDIARSDDTGFSSGPHMHIEVRGGTLSPGSGDEGGHDSLLRMLTAWAQEQVDKGKDFVENVAMFKGMAKKMLIDWSVPALLKWLVKNFASKLKSLISSAFGTDAWNGNGQFQEWAKEAMSRTGVGDDWLQGLDIIAKHESNYNPNAANNWDSNAARGDPSRGIMQTIGATFSANALPDCRDIFNPVCNIAAAIRYIQGRYGHVNNTPGVRSFLSGGRYTNYGRGGMLPPGVGPVNETGRNEYMLSNSTFNRLLSVLDRLDRALGGAPQSQNVTFENHYADTAVAQEVVSDVLIALRTL